MMMMGTTKTFSFPRLLLSLVILLNYALTTNPLPDQQFLSPSLMISGGRSTTKSAVETKDDPFSSLSKLFKGTKYSQIEVQKALRNIAGNQATLKNMDGVTHQLQNSMGKRYFLIT